MKRIVTLFSITTLLASCGRESVQGVTQTNSVEGAHLDKQSVNVTENLYLGEPTPPSTPAPKLPWKYMAGADYGLRSDGDGDGAFHAERRGTPSHRGVDFLMPVGTPLSSPCDGEYLSGYESSFGNWVQIVCKMPAELQAANETYYVSMLYGHLSERVSTGNVWKAITKGTSIGKSGKTGNANSASVNPHVHYETIIHTSITNAKNELHGYGGATPAHLNRFMQKITDTCINPFGFKSLEQPFTFENRIDPVLLLSCLSSDKPAMKKPVSQSWIKWSMLYKVTGFDIDVGR